MNKIAAVLLVAVGAGLYQWWRYWQETYSVDNPVFVDRVKATVEEESSVGGTSLTYASEVRCYGARCSSKVRFKDDDRYLRYEEYDCRTMPCFTTRTVR